MKLNKRDIAERFARLPKQKQKTFLQSLQNNGIEFSRLPIVPAPIVPTNLQETFPLSYAQTRQWFLWQFDPKSTAYHIAGALKLCGDLDVEALKASFSALVARHESLRTVFQADKQGQIEQRIEEPVELAIPVIDMTAVEPCDRDSRVEAEVRRFSETPFDLTSGPLLRVGLVCLAAREYLLVVVMHHIISDGWSMQILIDEFVAQYRARLLGEEPRLQPLPIQYADYAVWQRHWLEAGEKGRQLDYWKAQLGGVHPVLQLPVDCARRADGRYRAARYGVELPAALARGLRRRAEAEGATLFMLLLTGFQLLLSRYTGQRDIRVGVPIANRHRVETEGVIGFFVNTQVLRNLVNGRASLSQILQQTKDAALDAQAHQDLPFEQLVEALQPERSLSSSPLFQVMYNHMRGDSRALHTLPGLTLEEYALGEQAAQFELTLDTLEDAEGRVRASFTYARELFEAETIARMAEHYQKLLTALEERPDCPVSEVAVLSDAEQRRLREWGVNDRIYPEAEPVHRLFEYQAAQRPDAVALIFDDRQLRFAELNRRANQLAHYLISLGVEPETKVGIALERSIEMVVGLLAILKAGGAYVPLDPEYPRERLAHMVEDSGIELLLTQSHFRARMSAHGLQTAIELDAIDLSGEPEHNPQVPLHGENLAYVIYTSGSTGKPKGVSVAHGPLSMHLQAVADTYGITAQDKLLQFASLSFDAAGEQWMLPCISGATLVLRQQDIAIDAIESLVCRNGVTILYLPPADLRQLLDSLGSKRLPVRLCIAGGEAWSLPDYRAVQRLLSPQRTFNAYGPTETVISPTVWDSAASALDEQAYVPVGRPVGVRKAYILDENLCELPQGVVGELYLGGVGLARGYLNRAALTAERFVADPQGLNGERLYRTGDLMRWNREGQLEYLGRVDHQVKIRGFRIELGEVEAQLLAQPEVKQAVVVVQDGPAGSRLVGYVAVGAESGVEGASLRERLSERLPDYMVPSLVVTLDALPLNPNGKVDRKALPAAEIGSDQVYEAPRGPVEEALAAIWSEVLSVEPVGRHDNFFALGGHSLLALTLLERLRRHGWSVSVRTLFQHPQLRAFAQAIARGEERGTDVMVPPNAIPAGCDAIRPDMVTLMDLTPEEIARIELAVPGGAGNIQDIYPLAPLQEGMLFHHLLSDSHDAYITCHTLSFDSRSRLERFRYSFNQVIARHDILRTAILWEKLREPVQVVYRQAELSLHWLAEERAADVIERLGDLARIDVRQAPMIKAVAARDSERRRWLLQLTSHHLVLDHTTLERLVEEMALIQQGRQAQLPEPLPFRDFVARARLGVSQAAHEAFFAEMLGDVEEPTAPFNLLNVQGDGTGLEEVRLPLPAELSARLRRQAQCCGVGAAALFHLAWALVVGKTSGRDDVVFGTVLFGRLQGAEGAERALGLFINTLPLRVRLRGQSVEQALRQVHKTLTALLHHEHASLSLAQRCSALPGGTPLFTALLNYRYTARPDKAAVVWEGMEVLGGGERTNYPVAMSVDDQGEGFDLVAQVSAEIEARRFCDYLHAAIRGVVSALESAAAGPVSEIDLLGDVERARLQQWGVNNREYPEAEPVHRLFERQVTQQPDAIALRFDDDLLSYADLNRRANRLAHYLIGLGVGPETKVGIAVERSIEMVVGLLGILKAGGAYVPLDPEYPRERLAYMVEDSGIGLLLTQSAIRHRVPTGDFCTVLDLDTLDFSSPEWSAQANRNPQVPLHGSNLAYVIYTSGSTGKPKGAANLHGSLASCMLWMQQTYGLIPSARPGADTVLHKAPFGFDVSAWELFWPLTSGARLALARPGDHRDAGRIISLIRQHEITTLNFVPVMLQALLAQEGIERDTRLRYIICGGEAMPAATQWEALSRLQGASLQNLYGPTEATIHVTQWTCRDDGRTQVPIGRPISGIQTHVLDAGLNPVPIGIAGELYLGGIGLARGYLNRAALTAERFVANPLSAEGGRLYRTGDLVRWNAEGQLEYLGRIDHQVKIRGFRIELGEVEAQLMAQPGVNEAVVIAKQGPAGVRLVAYISAAPCGERPDSIRLKQALAETLPSYMVPGAIVVLESLPLTPNGKVDRQSLPEPELGAERPYEAPQGKIEQALAEIWAEVLGVERVGRLDNFFELGGDSILALKVLVKMQSIDGLQTNFSLKQLMACQTIQKLVASPGEKTEADLKAFAVRQLTEDRHSRQKNRCALFCIAPGLRDSIDYRPLAWFMQNERQVYGLSCIDYSYLESMDSLAEYYVNAIRNIQPEGPYAILGWSLSGIVALYVAKKLEAYSQPVSFLGLVDCFIPKENPVTKSWKVELVEFLSENVEASKVNRIIAESEVEGEVSVHTLHRLVDRVLSEFSIALPTEEIVDKFMAHRKMNSISANIRKLPETNISPSIWWAEERSESEIKRFDDKLGKITPDSDRVNADHMAIIKDSVLIRSVSSAIKEAEIRYQQKTT